MSTDRIPPAWTHLFFRRPRMLVLAVALILVAGFSALEVLPRAEDPELLSRNALVVTPYPGASAERVESQVTEKIEDELEEVEEVHLIESVSRAGVSIVSVELADEVTATGEIWSRVRDRIDDAAATFPAGAGPAGFEEATITAWTLITGLTWDRADAPNLAILGRLAEDLEDALRAVPGTDEAEAFGAPQEEIAVTVDAARLAARGLSTDALARALTRGDSKVPSGVLRAENAEVLLEVAGELDGLQRIASVPVTTGTDGSVVRLGEIATLERGVADPPQELALVDGVAGVLVATRLAPGERVDRWAERAHTALEDFAAELPAGVGLTVVFDQSGYTEERLAGLFGNLALGAALVILVILFAMGWRSALLVGSALPLAALMVFAGMRALGIPMDQMSVTGLIIALGLLIDNAIVMVDEVQHRLAHDEDVATAVGKAVKSLAVPLLASTATTVLAFMPLVLAVGPVGEFVGAMSMAVVLAVVSSFALSLTVIPALTGFARRFGDGAAAGWLRHGVSSPRLTELYRRFIGVLVSKPALGLVIALALPVYGFVRGSGLQEQFFPPAGRDQAWIELTVADVASIDRTRMEVDRADALLHANPNVQSVSWVLGRSAPKFYYNQLELVEGSPSYASAIVALRSKDGAVDVIRALQRELDDELPGAQTLVRQLEQGPPFEAPIELIVQGPDVRVLREQGEALRALLASVPGVIHTRMGLDEGRAKLLFTPDDDELDRASLDRVGVAEHLSAALSGAVGGSIFEGAEEIPVRVRLSDDVRAQAGRIASLEIAGEDGWTPLDALGEIALVPEASRIPHRDGVRTNEVQGFVVAGTLPQDALDEVQRRLAGFELPPGYALTFGGESAERDDAVGKLAASAGVLMVLMAATLVLAFGSFRMATIVGGVAALSVGLSLGALATFGHPFGFMAIVGTMGLIGIAINDSIVVLAALRADPDARTGDVRAIADVVVRSTRHVLSTTVTTIAGFIPLLMETEGLWPPLATSIAGGVGGATLLALTFVPSVYVLMTKRARKTAMQPALAGA